MPVSRNSGVSPLGQGDKGWEKRIPLTYGSKYQHLSWMKEYEEFCRIVEGNRKAAFQRKHETLVERSARSVAQNLSRVSPEALGFLPDHVLSIVVEEIMADPKVLMTLKDDVWDVFPLAVLQAIWDSLYERCGLHVSLPILTWMNNEH